MAEKNTEKVTNSYENMPLKSLVALVDELNQESQQCSIEKDQMEMAVQSINRPFYVFSFSFPPLFSVPNANEKNKIDLAFKKAQENYQAAISRAVEASLVLNSRLKKQSDILSALTNLTSHQAQRNSIQAMSEPEKQELTEYLAYQTSVLEKDCALYQNRLKGSWLNIFRGKDSAELLQSQLAQAQSALIKMNHLQTLIGQSQNPQMPHQNRESKRKGPLGFKTKEFKSESVGELGKEEQKSDFRPSTKKG